MSVQAGGETRCGIGTRLRAGREQKGLTVLQAAEKLHVDPKILESLESEDFDALGAPVYVRGHLRHYAELVGEQPGELQSLYANSIRVAPPDLTRVPKVVAPSDPRRFTVPATAVLLTFAIAGGVWWVMTLSKGHAHPSSTPAAAAKPVAALAATSPREAPSVESGAPVAAAEAPRVAAPTASASRGATGSRGAANTSTAPGEGAPGAARAGRQAQLTLRFSSESWAEVYDSNGERLFYDVGPADSVRTFKGTPPLRVVLGNAPGVAVEVNGRVADLGNLTRTDGTAQFVVGRAGRVSQSPSPSP
jgi:cytoskeleton protein RodZ